MNNKWVQGIFWALVAVFVLLLGIILTPQVNRPSAMIAIYGLIALAVVFFLLGAALILLTVKRKVYGKSRTFLLLTGAAAAGVPVFAVLHNIASGLLGSEEAVFFTLATLVCPLGFLAGAAGVIVLIVKSKKLRS